MTVVLSTLFFFPTSCPEISQNISQPIVNGASNEPAARVDLAKLKVRKTSFCPAAE